MGISRAFIYGDLLIETLAVTDGRIRFGALHFERLTRSAALMNFQLPADWSYEYFHALVAAQCPGKSMRARLVTYRSGNGFYLSNTNEVSFQVDYWMLPAPKTVIEEAGIFAGQQKAATSLSNLKSGNALLYVLASQYAADMKWEEALVLNSHYRVIEATSSNIFWIEKGQIFTPPLSEGPVAGVMREALILHLKKQGLPVAEKMLETETLMQADECFLTNAINPMVSVKKIKEKQFQQELTDVIRKEFLNIIAK